MVFGLLIDSSAGGHDGTGLDEERLEFSDCPEGADHDVLSVQVDTVRVARPGRFVGRSVDPRSPQLRARPGGEDPFRRFREASSHEPPPARLFGGIVGVIEFRV
jgi:hypothetical protein